MPTRATKKTEVTVRSAAASHRRNGRPRTATASSKIYSDLRTELVSLQRRPGEVVSEAEIALSYGVSRTPVREAILKLADEGLLEIFPQSGIFVSRIPMAALPEAIKDVAMMEKSDIIIANLTPFAGASADAGTLIEVGWFLGKGKPIFGYSNTPENFESRMRRQLGAKHADLGIEGFHLPVSHNALCRGT